jgi:menaquinone-dependent protoporphyrinogen oxidase
MRVLVTAASRHGSTQGIADAIAEVLFEAGIDADIRNLEAVLTLEGYDAAVIGSAVYAGHWLPQARAFVDDHHDELVRMPVWLFSSGPIGEPPKPIGDPPDVADLVAQVHAVGHRTFPGRLDQTSLGIAERLIATVIRVKPGDYRPWSEVSEWAREIVAALPAARLAVAAAGDRVNQANWAMPL